MNTSIIVILAAAVGLVVNTIAIIAVAWRGGHLLGRLQQVVETLGLEVDKLRTWRTDSANIETRLSFLEREYEIAGQKRGGRRKSDSSL